MTDRLTKGMRLIESQDPRGWWIVVEANPDGPYTGIALCDESVNGTIELAIADGCVFGGVRWRALTPVRVWMATQRWIGPTRYLTRA